MKKILILLILISIYSCSDKNEQKIEYVKHQIPFLNGEINIPKDYISISFDDYKNIIKDSYTDTTFVKSKVLAIEKMKDDFPYYVMFCDKNNIENTFIMTYMLNQRVNKWIKDELAKYMITEMKYKGYNEKFKYTNMQNKLINDWTIKIKGKLVYDDYPENEVYSTQYMSEIFGAFVINYSKEIDFEKEINEIKYN